ncbi:MAG: ABC transporter substrate-binding protein [Spirochaetaceae bacterium]|nr:ABC transporter substrate-binding protein [Spirochaetaceae bacterium]
MKRTVAFALTIFLCLGFLFGFGSKEELPTAIDPANPSPQDEDFLFSQRIVSLVPSVTETLFAIDAQDMIVARTDFCTWPPEVAAIPSVGGFDGKTISLERILSFKPDLVCLAEVMHNHLIQPLEDLGIEVFVSNAESVQHIQDEILMLGSFTGKMDDTMLLLDTISWQLEQARIQATEKATAESPDTVYWEVAAAPYFTPGKDSFITDLLAVIGLENIFAQVPQAYPQVSEESIIAGQPQVIFFPDYNHQGQQAVQTIARRAGWQTLPAVINGKIFPVDSDLFSRPGPRIGEMALQLVDLIYGLPPQLEGAP